MYMKWEKVGNLLISNFLKNVDPSIRAKLSTGHVGK